MKASLRGLIALTLIIAGLGAVNSVAAATRTTSTTYCEQADVDAGTCPLLGLVTSVDGPRTDISDVTTYTYYPSEHASCATSPATCPYRKGDLWMVMDAVGNVTETLAYDGAGRVLSVKDANNVITDFEYHPRGWLTARKVRGTDPNSEADDRITRIEYYPTGLVQKTTLPDGSFTAYTYDAAHRLTDITDGEGNRIHYTLDNAGNRTREETLGAGSTVVRTLSRVYNQLGELQTHKDAYDHATGFIYDANGNTDTVTDALNRVTDNDYDPLNRLSRTIQDVGGLNVTTQFQYDAQDNLTAVVDPKGLTTGYTYNGLGDLTQLSSPDTGITTYTYDSAGNRKSQTDARGITVDYSYDASNRLVSATYPTSGLNTVYTYDTAYTASCTVNERFTAGRLARVVNGYSDLRYCYDRFGNLTRKVVVSNGLGFHVLYGYTSSGQLSSVTYPDGSNADYVHDELGRVIEVGYTRSGGVRQVLVTAVAYHPFGPPSEWTFGNGRLFQRTLNQNYQPDAVKDAAAGGLSVGYEFDAVGNMAALRNGDQDDPPLRSYGYDALNRLIEARDVTGEAYAERYSYDATGNRTSATVGNAAPVIYTTAQDSHRLMDAGGVARTYDAAGNTLSIGGTATQFTYDNAGRMFEAKRNGAVVMNYRYNAMGEQVRRFINSTYVYSVHDEAGHWLGEYDTTGAPLQQIVWLDDLPIAMVNASGVKYIEADALGTPRVVIDAVRNVALWRWDLAGEAFGNTAPNQNYDGDAYPLYFNMRFPGQRYDAASGLNQNYYRELDPESGRYTQPDPIGLDGGLSAYSYVSSNPLTKVDYFGLLEHFVFNLNDKNMSTLACECGKTYDAFSGSGDARNDPGQSQNVDDGPIPPGRYYIVKRPSGGRLGFVDTWKGKDDWFALYADDGSPNDTTATGIYLRGQFRLHPGTISKGCVTLPSRTDFEDVKKRLLNTKPAYIPGTKTLYYGTITVK